MAVRQTKNVQEPERKVDASDNEISSKSSPWANVSNEILNVRIQGAIDANQPKSDPNDDPVLKALKKEIAFHEEVNDSTSYLGKVFDYVYANDQKSLEELKTMYEDYGQALGEGNAEKLTAMQTQIQQKISHDMETVGFQEEIKQM